MGQLESVYIEGIDDVDNDSILHGDLTVERIAKIIKDGEVKNIVVMSGAGISVSAGIPDFRTPGTRYTTTWRAPLANARVHVRY